MKSMRLYEFKMFAVSFESTKSIVKLIMAYVDHNRVRREARFLFGEHSSHQKMKYCLKINLIWCQKRSKFGFEIPVLMNWSFYEFGF